jgi:hypothetical protein
MPLKKNNHAIGLLIFIQLIMYFNMPAQEIKHKNKAEKDSSEIVSKGFHKGYIVMRESGDTIRGQLKWHVFMGNIPEWVDFKTDDEHKKKPYRADSIIGFGNEEIQWRFFNFSGWSKLIVTGTINVFKGYASDVRTSSYTYPTGVSGTTMTTPTSKSTVFALKKGTEKAIFISSGKTLERGVLKESQKYELEDWVSESPDVISKLVKSDFRFKDLPALIVQYNEWIKLQK